MNFTLDTKAPSITISTPTDGGTLAAGAILSGIADSTGSSITRLTYAFDGGMPMPFTADATSGAFSTPLDLSKMTGVSHTLTLSATDAAGNTVTTTENLQLPQAIPLSLANFTPMGGSNDIGSTYRPKLTFSRPIDPATLTSSNFFATDSTGAKIPANIVVSDDDTYAGSFSPIPCQAQSTISITVDGSTILPQGGGAALDADGTGTAGSKLLYQFSTVSLTSVLGTSLSGIVADPGPDLKPMSIDDLKPGPDGVTGTANDIYKFPIAGVKVYIVGQESQAVYTDAQGRFSFASIPSGDVKLALDGNTATNAPAGMYFPEMVMDLNIRPGVANTVMGAMTNNTTKSIASQVLGVYLPRIQSSILQTVSNTQTTTISVDAQSAPNLTQEQAQNLFLEVPPNSAIGMNGQKMTNA